MGQVLMDSGLASTIVTRDGGKRSKNRRFAKGAILRYKGEGVRQSRRTKARVKAAESANSGGSALQKAKAKAADSRRTRFCATKAKAFGNRGGLRQGRKPQSLQTAETLRYKKRRQRPERGKRFAANGEK